MSDLQGLNPAQREAVTITEGPLLVLAGAGSGKTRVIVHRIARLLQNGVDPAHVLAVTFTNKAAAEMRERVARLVPKRAATALTVGTFHAFGLQVLREHGQLLGLTRRIALADAGDQLALVKRAMADVKVDDRAFDPRRVQSLISLARNEGVRPGQPLRPEGAFAPHGEEYDELAAEILPRYELGLRAMGLVDFDDLLLLPLQLLAEHPPVRAALHDRHRYLQVDEFQDTNHVQLQLLRALGLPRGNVCAVGDDDQAIYGWRGARVDNILQFGRHFPGAKEVRLEQNYRSTGHILACANAVIAGNAARKPKTLFTTSGDGPRVKVTVCPDGDAEAQYVARELRASLASGRRAGDHAVLYRVNLQSRAFEEALRTENIPFEVVGGTEFFDRREVKDLLAYLRAFVNESDEISLLRIVNFPARGIGDVTIEKVRRLAQAEKIPLMVALRRAGKGAFPEVEAAAKRIDAFVTLVETHGARLRKGEPASQVARAVIEEVDLRGAISAGVASPEAAARRLAMLDETLVSLERYEKREGRKSSLAQYLAQLALDRSDEVQTLPGDRVALMSLHAAKGLEFPVVFLTGLEEDLLPHRGIQGAPQDLAEERRLAYVGITRAREELHLTRAAVRVLRGKEAPRTPSRFLDELPASAVEKVDVAAPTPASEKRSETFFADLVSRLGSRP
jgi:DNA helicase-2/ATP-dependent DNA helicase PcrA